MPIIPIINKEPGELWTAITHKFSDGVMQRRLVLIIVCVALLLDNMLYMVIVPIIPVYLTDMNKWGPKLPSHIQQKEGTVWYKYNETYYIEHQELMNITGGNKSAKHLFPLVTYHGYKNEDARIGVLFASKAIVQLLVNPLSGTVIDRIGYDVPMMIGLSIIFLSTAVFAFGKDYSVLFIARSMQGVGSAFADTAGLAMIADRYKEEGRARAQGIALAFISFGCLFAPPFGGFLYEFSGKCVPFLLLATVALIDGGLMMVVMKPVRKERSLNKDLPKGTPIHKLIMDPYIALCAGALVMANVSLAFVEPTIALWMKDTMNSSEWEIGIIWLPAFFPHVLGVFLTVKAQRIYPDKCWLITAVGLVLEGISCLILPFCHSVGAIMVPLMINCFGIALVDTAILPTLGHLVDVRHVPVYGSVYAIADISYCLAYAFGPIVAGGIVASIGFTWLNVGIFISNILYAPLLYFLKNVYKYTEFKNESDTLVNEPQNQQQYKTYVMNNLTGSTPKEEMQNNINSYDYGITKTEDAESTNPFYQNGGTGTEANNVITTRRYQRDSSSIDSDNDIRPYH